MVGIYNCRIQFPLRGRHVTVFMTDGEHGQERNWIIIIADYFREVWTKEVPKHKPRLLLMNKY